MNYGRKGIRDRQMTLNARGPKWAKKILLLIAELICIALLGSVIVVAAFGIGAFKGLLSTAPDISKINVTPINQASFVYDANGNQIDKLVAANSNRINIDSEDICQDLKDAFVAIEDQRFYQHNGIDIQGIIHAGYDVVTKGRLGAGASTITQQLIKNNVFTDWATEENDIQKIRRKIQEQYCAVQLEKNYSKDAILTTYLNTINCGHNTLGVEAASLRYFAKHASELTLSECAVIAGITNAPVKYDPIIHPENNRERMKIVLYKMLELGYITETELNNALADDVYSRIDETNEITVANTTATSYFVDALTIQLEKDLVEAGYTSDQAYYLLYSGGLQIYSTMDPEIQRICDEVFADPKTYEGNDKWLLDYKLTVKKADGTLENHSNEMIKKYFQQKNRKFNMIFTSTEAAYEAVDEYQLAVLEEGDEVFAEELEISPQPQISFTVEKQSTGEIVAMIGGRGVKDKSRSLNRATQSERQPGSCFKVLAAFGPAIDVKGMSLATVYNDAPFCYVDGTPVANWYGAEYRGLQSIRAGIYNSLNVVAVKTITQITPELGFNYLKNMGFTTLAEAEHVGDQIFTDIGQPLALGGITHGVLNYELNAAYAAIANGGTYIEPKLYTKVVDSDGNVILDNSAPVTRQIFSPQTSFLLTSAMQDCVNIGTGTGARFPGMSIAGKTGTTSNERDVWFAGYTPYYTATSWVGFDNNEIMTANEQKAVRNVFREVMKRVHEDLPDIGFPVPEGIVRATVCSQSGKLPNPGICDGCLKSEYFARENVPTEYCDVHYIGRVCGYDNLRATEQCPFAYEGVATLPPVEDESLWQGSNTIAAELDPLHAGVSGTPVTQSCHHNEQFFMQENWEGILAQEQFDYEQRILAAQAAAAPSYEE